MTKRSRFVRLASYLPVGAAIGLVLFRLQPVNGFLGHDFYHAFVRLLIGATHFWRNGFQIPHFTPSLCGGIPFFADPQSTYFSLPQLLTFFLQPLVASWVSIALFYLIGFLGMERLLREIAGCKPLQARVLSVGFLLNGFSYSHLFVGHLTHHSYLLIPGMMLWLLRPLGGSGGVVRASAWLSLGLLYFLYSGGFHMLVVFSVLGVLLTPYLLLTHARRGELRRFFFLISLTALVFVAAGSGKIVAAMLFAKHFVKGTIDRSELGVLELVVQYFWYRPDVTPLFIRFGRLAFGPWEFVGFLSKGVLALAGVGALWACRLADRNGRWVVAAYLLLVPYLFLLGAGGGGNEWLPLFRVYHDPIKIYGAFLPVFVLLAGFALTRLSPYLKFSSEGWRHAVYFIGSAALLAEFDSYSRPILTNPLARGFRNDPTVFETLKARRGILPVDSMIAEHGADLSGLKRGCSSLKCYEPLFGYRSETLHSRLSLGPTASVADGFFNINHPGCFLYPEHFGCQAWDRVRAEDRDAFRRFVDGDSVAWRIPYWHSILLYLNGGVIGLLLTVVLCPWGVLARLAAAVRRNSLRPREASLS